ncbi:hypothetical protein M514_17168 [Trichuris suis]|uniref:Uncharacterized protein n=1 Tax=Trichuris suis TaxID=68888 RepID=A0A085NMK0_9BILA|nr:hypothetical protein M514_17168 [Trichuris suis]
MLRCTVTSDWYDFISCGDIHSRTIVLTLHALHASGMSPQTIISTDVGVIPSNHGQHASGIH